MSETEFVKKLFFDHMKMVTLRSNYGFNSVLKLR